MSSYWQRRLNRKLSEQVEYQEPDEVQKLVDRGADVNRAEGHARGSPLYVATLDPRDWSRYYGKMTQLVTILLKAGADPDAAEEGGDTPLLQALLHSNLG